ncbi:hypothetical protein [Ralstonia pseudosolanacearum]|uniref:hypothetical protein n=1 Tax=Ralstonia pseudosolanacearum TaxID=1310165 RepID=UPI002006ABE0|nr:hypothetical protein [Ralstonia pseudosolanacearum]MCK4154199.1 hypothetical protein [Ralstonia pseudosolanacearum]
MSGADFQAGLGAGYARANATRAEGEAAVSEWAAYCKQLEERLARAEEKAIFLDAQLDGEAALRRQLDTELRRFAPAHALLDKGRQQEVKANAVGEALRQRGYEYDTKTFRVSRKP